MKCHILLCITIIVFMTANAQDFESYKWKNRLVIILSNDKDSEIFQKQLKELDSDHEGLKERKLIVYKILPEGQKITYHDGTWIYNSEMYRQYTNKNEYFKVVLIGLDGGIKLNQNKLLTIEELFSKIDVMPMRRSEINNNNK